MHPQPSLEVVRHNLIDGAASTLNLEALPFARIVLPAITLTAYTWSEWTARPARVVLRVFPHRVVRAPAAVKNPSPGRRTEREQCTCGVEKQYGMCGR